MNSYKQLLSDFYKKKKEQEEMLNSIETKTFHQACITLISGLNASGVICDGKVSIVNSGLHLEIYITSYDEDIVRLESILQSIFPQCDYNCMSNYMESYSNDGYDFKRVGTLFGHSITILLDSEKLKKCRVKKIVNKCSIDLEEKKLVCS